MLDRRMGKGAALLCVALLAGVTACGTGTADDLKSEGEKVVSSRQENYVKEEGLPEAMITPVPEISAAIEEIGRNEVTEQADRTAVVRLSDDGIEIDGSGCKADGSRLKIKEAGAYEISGTLSNGSIYVNADNDSEVHLILNGVTVHNETSAALFCKKAAKVTITLAEGSVNTFSDGASYVFEEGEDEPDSTLYSKQDLVINGSGKLVVTSAYGDAVKGKDSLYILGGELSVTSAEDGIVGRDLLYVADGTITVTAAADALKASNDTDTTLGNIVIDSGSFVLTAGTDGIQAENVLTVNGGTFVIKTGGGSANATVKSDHFGFGGGREWGKWGDWNYVGETETEEASSAKGMKAGIRLTVTGGQFDLDTFDDALHSNADVTIVGGKFLISSGDDGAHADETLRVDGDCKIQITKSYEGLEALTIEIGGGTIDIVASDDGLNAAGGADGSGFGGFGRPGMGMFREGEGEVIINGGKVVVNADGDGLDSNGNLTVNGGTITVFGPTSGANGVLDFGGAFALNGGTFLAVGTSGMAQTPSDSSKQYSLAAVLESRGEAGSTVEIIVDGETVVSGTVPKQFNYIVASSKAFIGNAKVSVVINGETVYSGTLTGTVTGFGTFGGKGGFGGMGGFGGREDTEGKKGFGGKGDFGEGMRPGFPKGEIPQEKQS